jgi:hypothetical protein
MGGWGAGNFDGLSRAKRSWNSKDGKKQIDEAFEMKKILGKKA